LEEHEMDENIKTTPGADVDDMIFRDEYWLTSDR
jgi:hypothetical protein